MLKTVTSHDEIKASAPSVRSPLSFEYFDDENKLKAEIFVIHREETTPGHFSIALYEEDGNSSANRGRDLAVVLTKEQALELAAQIITTFMQSDTPSQR